MTEPYTYLPLDGHPRLTRQDVCEMWLREGALDAQEASRRVEEVLLVAATADGEPAGVSTVHLLHERQLRMDLWFYRTYVAARHRRSQVAEMLVHGSFALLQRRWTDGEDRRGAGMAFHMQNQEMRAAFPHAVWPRVHMAYVTRTPMSDMRVRYFPGALAPDPPRS